MEETVMFSSFVLLNYSFHSVYQTWNMIAHVADQTVEKIGNNPCTCVAYFLLGARWQTSKLHTRTRTCTTSAVEVTHAMEKMKAGKEGSKFILRRRRTVLSSVIGMALAFLLLVLFVCFACL